MVVTCSQGVKSRARTETIEVESNSAERVFSRPGQSPAASSFLGGNPQVTELLQWSFCIRALCHLVLKQYKEAEKDCTEALKLDGKNVKAFYRRAQAYKALKVKTPTQTPGTARGLCGCWLPV